MIRLLASLFPSCAPASAFGGLLGKTPVKAPVARHLNILEARLRDVEWLNGESCSVADIAHFAWVRSASYAGFDLRASPTWHAWAAKIAARPATARALARLA